MMNTQNRLWILMGKKLSGNITLSEEEELDALFQAYPDVWYTYEILMAGDAEKVPDEFMGELRNLLAQNNAILPDAVSEPVADETVRPLRLPHKLTAAAVLIIVASLSWLLLGKYLPTGNNVLAMTNNIITVQNGTRTDVTLPDGSLVKLNAGSRLSYAKNYASAKTREVYLSGEAFFKVTHNPRHMFIIHTPHFDIKDIGTSFNVKAYPGDKTAETTLLEGAVEISFKNHPGRTILLSPHQKVLLHIDAIMADKKTAPTLPVRSYEVLALDSDRLSINHFAETAWIDNQLIFKNESFGEVAKRMERKYNISIAFNNRKVENTTLTGVFRNEDIEEAFKELQQIASFRFQINRDSVIISGQ